MAELGAALEAKYPGWLIDVQQPHNRYTTSVPSMERRVDTEVLIVSAIEPRAWQHRVAWHWEEGGPLLADDVTGTTAYADWAAKQGAKA